MAAFHVAFPLCHFVLYPSHPSWTEEGHHGAWHMMLLDTAGTPLQAVYVVSCSSSMDARPARKLYILSANLPDYEGQYERLGVSMVGKFLYPLAPLRAPLTRSPRV